MRSFFALALLPLLAARAADGDEKARAGQPLPDFELKDVLGGDGRSKISEFRGQPVLIAEYSTGALEAARPAVDLEREFDEYGLDRGLIVFLMETKDGDATHMRALQMAELPGTECRLLPGQELPVVYDDAAGPAPEMILVGVDGTLLYAGSYKRADQVKKLLKAELAKMKKGWGKDPVVKKARALAWGDGKLGEARALLADTLMAGPLGGAEPEFTSLATELVARFETLERSIGRYLEDGKPGRALAAVGNLTAAAGKDMQWVGRATAAIGLSAQATRELELELELDTLLKPTLKSKPQKGLDEKLRAFAAGAAAGTKVGARAATLADAVALAAGG